MYNRTFLGKVIISKRILLIIINLNTMDDIKEIGQNLVDLAELKIEALRRTLPNKQQTLYELDIAMNQNKPNHLTEEQWQSWLNNGKKIRENFVKSYES